MSRGKISQYVEAIEQPRTGDISSQIAGALRYKSEMTPHLLDILTRVLADPAAYLERPGYAGHIYSLFLLGHYREPQAHRLIVALFSLPAPVPDQLFGAEIISEYVPLVLYRTCAGSLEQVKTLVLNRQADDFCRGAAMQSLVYAASEKMVARRVVVDFFATCFDGDEAGPGSQFWSLLAGAMYDLHPEGVMPILREAYDRRLISPRVVRYEDLETVLQRDQAATLAKVREKWRSRSLKWAVLSLARTGTFQEIVTIPSLGRLVRIVKSMFKPPLP